MVGSNQTYKQTLCNPVECFIINKYAAATASLIPDPDDDNEECKTSYEDDEKSPFPE